MTDSEAISPELKFLEDRWDPEVAATLDEPELLRYRSNLLGSDLRITNFAGGNTSSKIGEIDPVTGETVAVLWVKGSGGDLGSIRRSGFATLYQERFLALERLYRGEHAEDEMVELYALCSFRNNPVPASIDTPLHGFLPFKHVDHLHPDWGIALAASANGKAKMEQFNREFKHRLVWIPWQRPGFELAMMMRRAVEQNPGCDGIVLGGHGLFTWGDTQRECYRNTITLIDQLGQYIARHAEGRQRFGGEAVAARGDRGAMAAEILPYLRGRVSGQRRWIASFTDSADVLEFVCSQNAKELAFLGTSCPDHFIRTKIRPMFVEWGKDEDTAALKRKIDASLEEYRRQYRAYYEEHAEADSPALRDVNPTVVLIPGLGMFSFGKTKTEARIVGEFYTNAIHVMEGATMLGEEAAGGLQEMVPQCGERMRPESFKVFTNYVAMPLSEAFRIEYWQLEEAKLRRQPAEKELSRRIALVVGGGSGVGREVALRAASRGAHVMVADRDAAAAQRVVEELAGVTAKESVGATALDTRSRESIRSCIRETVLRFGGIDMLMDATGDLADEMPALCEEVARVFAVQDLPAAIVMTGAGRGETVRELAVGLGPKVRVNGIAEGDGLSEGAAAMLFLASDEARCTTGHVIPVDGKKPFAD